MYTNNQQPYIADFNQTGKAKIQDAVKDLKHNYYTGQTTMLQILTNSISRILPR